MEKHLENINFNHTPIMLTECIEGLNIKPDGIYVDGTFGGGGHSSKILERLTTGKLIAIDKDPVALEVGRQRLGDNPNIIFVKNDFKNFVEILDGLGIDNIDGVLLDLGVSSYQLDTAERGFSYRFDAPLDMRMDTDNSFSAYNVVNEYSEKELSEILFRYGEEPFARKIAHEIVATRKLNPIKTTKQLADIIEKVVFKKKGANPCTKTFQAIRIEVNSELERLDSVINSMIDKLKSGGRIAIITFHSLEDRIVKTVFKNRSSECICDKSFPVCICGHKKEINILTKKPLVASEEEQKENTRSTCAKLRIAEKIWRGGCIIWKHFRHWNR